MENYVNPDHSAQRWDQKIKALMEGRVAFGSMGDWADGEFLKANMKEKEDFGWVSHPGTDGSFIIVADGFPQAKGAPQKDAALAWLKMVGSEEAQEAFITLKGSIPARTDVDYKPGQTPLLEKLQAFRTIFSRQFPEFFRRAYLGIT